MSSLRPCRLRWAAVVGTVVPTLAVLACAGPTGEAADLVLRGGKIVTLDDSQPEVQALAARDGRIIAIGSEQDVAHLIGSDTEVIERGHSR